MSRENKSKPVSIIMIITCMLFISMFLVFYCLAADDSEKRGALFIIYWGVIAL